MLEGLKDYSFFSDFVLGICLNFDPLIGLIFSAVSFNAEAFYQDDKINEGSAISVLAK